MRYAVVLDYGRGEPRRYVLATKRDLEDARDEAEAYAIGCDLLETLPNGERVRGIEQRDERWHLEREDGTEAIILVEALT